MNYYDFDLSESSFNDNLSSTTIYYIDSKMKSQISNRNIKK